MPYISKPYREAYKKAIKELITKLRTLKEEERDGHVNFIITSILKGVYYPLKYRRFNALLGVLEAIKLELYRRIIGPYEDTKIWVNGDLEGAEE